MFIRDGKIDWKYFQWIPLLLCAAVLAGGLVNNMVQWERMQDFREAHTLAIYACLLCVSILFLKKGTSLSRFVSVYFLWLLVTRILLGDLSDSLRGELRCAAAMCIACKLGSTLDPRGRRTLLNCFTLVVVGIFSLWALYGLRVVLTDVGEIPLYDLTIHLTDELQDTGILRYLEFFMVHRNESAAWFMICLWLVIAQWFRYQNVLFRLMLTGVGILMYLMIALQHCRSVYVVTAIGFGMLAVLLLKDRLPNWKCCTRLAVIAIAALASMLVVYKGFSVCNQVIVQYTCFSGHSREQIPAGGAENQALPEQNDETEAQEETIPETESISAVPREITAEVILPESDAPEAAAPEDTAQLIDNRSFFRDLLTLTMRTEVWGAVSNTLRTHPEFLLLGQPEGEIALNLHRYGGMTRPIAHTHNAFAQALSLCGLPGLLLLLAMVVLLIPKMIRCFFSGAEITKKILTIPLTALLIYGVIEPMFSSYLEFSSVCLMLLAGLIVSSDNPRNGIVG